MYINVLKFFEDYPWPGNVRQLRHEVERLVALTPEGERITLANCSEELLNWRKCGNLEASETFNGCSLSEKVKALEIRCIKKGLTRNS